MEITVRNAEGDLKEFDISDKDVRDYLEENWDEVEEKFNLALKIGAVTIKASSTKVDTNYVDKEFQRLSTEFNERFRKFQEDWDKSVDSVFGEDFRKMQDCLDPDKPDTPTKRTLEYMDKMTRELIEQMDPNEDTTPLGRFKKDMLQNLKEIRDLFQAKKAAEEVEGKTTLKGIKYEDVVFTNIHDIGSTFMDTIESTGAIPGIGSSKKGDIVSELHGYDGLKIAMEVKDSGSLKKNDKYYKSEIQAAMDNRGAIASILIAHPSIYPFEKPFFLWKDNTVVCRYDPDTDDTTILEVAYQLSREIAIRMVQQGPEEFSLSDFEDTLKEISIQAMTLESVEKKLTRSINNITDIRDELNKAKTHIRTYIKELLDRISPEDDEESESVKQNSLLEF